MPRDDKDKSSNRSGPIDIIRQRGLYLAVSALLLIPGLVFIILMMMNNPNHAPLRLGIDFTGGTILEYAFEKKVIQDDLPKIREIIEAQGYTGPVVQIQEPRAELIQESKDATAAADMSTQTASEAATVQNPAEDDSLDQIASLVSIRTKQLQGDAHTQIENALRQQFGNINLLQKNSVGPTLASELLTNGLMALLFAYILIVGYLTFRFQFDFAICALLALAHDTLFVFGAFAALGYLFQVEVDSMFITAILTVVGFSVHDTIVVFDRLRENLRIYYSRKLPFAEIANISVNQTLARSINTSLTALLPLLALYFMGGETTRSFVLAIILGIIVGTYSSICVASLLLTWWRGREGPTLSTNATAATS